MNLYISDLHFGHANVIRFDNRPFTDRDEMERVLIASWNDRVCPDDDIWIVGDFCWKSDKAPEYYLKKLQGHKHLIVGNHDSALLENPKALHYLESVDKMTHIADMLDGQSVQVVMCHFPIAEWNKMQHGSVLVYGHIHNRRDDTYHFMKTRPLAFNAGCMINHYAPASLYELRENNRRFQEM